VDEAAVTLTVLDEDAEGRSALHAFLQGLPGAEVLAALGDTEEMLQALSALRRAGRSIDVAVVNTHVGGLDAVAATSAILRAFPEVRVLILTTVRDPWWAERVIGAGARGYVLKDGDVEYLESAIAAIAAGGRHIDPVVGRRLAGEPDRGPDQRHR
jgi:DNA-binding NarL/FixJ family response regulator